MHDATVDRIRHLKLYFRARGTAVSPDAFTIGKSRASDDIESLKKEEAFAYSQMNTCLKAKKPIEVCAPESQQGETGHRLSSCEDLIWLPF
jgi:hypothetical protein